MIPQRSRRRLLWLIGIPLLLVTTAVVAFAYWMSTDGSTPAVAAADSVQAGNQPSLTGVNGQDVTVGWTASTTATGHAAVTGYTVARYNVATGGSAVPATGGCSGTVIGLTCTEQSVPANTWYYTVTPVLDSWVGHESSRSAPVPVVVPSLSFTANQTFNLPGTLVGGAITHFKANEGVAFHLDTASGTVLTGSILTVDGGGQASSFTVTIPLGTADGSHTVVAVGAAGSQATSNTFIVDTVAPTVSSINIADPSPTKAGTLHWTVTFSEPVSNVVAADFGFVTSGTGGTAPSITSVSSGPASTYTVTVNTSATTGTNAGSIGLNLISAGSIADAAGNALSTTTFTGQTYTYDTTAPTVVSINRSGTNPTNVGPLGFTVTFSEPVSNVVAADFGLASSNITGTPTIGTPSGTAPTATWTVSVTTSGVTGANNGSIGLNLTSAGSIADAAGNALSTTTFTGQAYTYDTTAPTVTITSLGTGGGSSKVKVTGTGTTGDGNVTVYLCHATPCSSTNAVDTGSVPVSAGTWSYTSGNIGSATYYAAATQTDAAGNTGSSSTFGPFTR